MDSKLQNQSGKVHGDQKWGTVDTCKDKYKPVSPSVTFNQTGDQKYRYWKYPGNTLKQ